MNQFGVSNVQQLHSYILSYIDINQPRWDQDTYIGRAKHFFTITNPLNVLATNKELDKAKDIVNKYNNGTSLKELQIDADQLWHAKNLYDSAFHPDTGEKMFILGRMSAQVPMNMLITGGMLTFYKTNAAVIFWQWINQSFNALVNYTNRSGSSPISLNTLGISYVLATSGALVTALGLNRLCQNAPGLIGRFVPFCAVAAANCVNIPMMRQKEIQSGIDIFDAKTGQLVGKSKKAAQIAIPTVIISRVLMCVPGMILPPILINHLEKKGFFKRYPRTVAPIQIVLCGILQLKVSTLEPDVKDKLQKLQIQTVFFNKGL